MMQLEIMRTLYISISSYDSVSVELESNNSHYSSEIESLTPYSGDFQPPADSAMSAERFDCVALCCASMDKPFQPKDKNTLQNLASKRNFQPQWYKKFPWLSVCLTRKKVFCLYCRYCTRQNLITFSKMGENAFTITGFQTGVKLWKNLNVMNPRRYTERLT